MSSVQTLLLGSQAPRIDAALQRLHVQQLLPRLWKHDASLWSADPATQELIRQRLGWLTIVRGMAKRTTELREFAHQIRQAGFQRTLLLGMGGSGLFAEVCRETFGIREGLDLVVLDTTDPTAIRYQQQQAPLSKTLSIVSSKSGSTSETSALCRYFYETFKSSGEEPGAHCVAITDAGSSLEAQAKTLRFRRIFTNGPGTGAEVGGRFSALTSFGLVPAALIGLDVDRLLARAEAMYQDSGPGVPVRDNPAAQLGAVLAEFAQAGRDKLTLVCAPELASFGTWVEQLVAESIGKQGRGIAPIHGEPLRDPASYQSDRVFLELRLSGQLDPGIDRQVQALAAAGHPVIRVHWQDRYDLGGEVAKWSLATAIAGALLGINPFDEPNVKESKDGTKQLLEHYVREGRLPAPQPPLFSDQDIAVYGKPAIGAPASLDQCLHAFLRQLREGDFIALLSFLPRTPSLDAVVHALRARLAERLGHATMVGMGPRYLHSTGQLFKGGSDRGVFLLLTAEESNDLPIPGEPFTFGILKQAQALGDFQAMQQRGRHVLHLHFQRDPDRVAQRVAQALEQALTQSTARSASTAKM